MSSAGSQSWMFVYMRNMDVSRIPPSALAGIWSELGVDRSSLGGISSLGAYLTEIIVATEYAPTLIQRLMEIEVPERLDHSLRIAADLEYCPLAPYAHLGAPRSFRFPDHAVDALARYARESVARRWSAMYHASRVFGVRRFILAQMKAHSLALIGPPSGGDCAGSDWPATHGGKRRFRPSHLVCRRSNHQGELGEDHLAQLVPLPSPSRIIAYTDGAYLHYRNAAGIGAYFAGVGIPPEAQRLPGFQSVARAEIFAMVMALNQVSRQVDAIQARSAVDIAEVWICSDSKHAVDGVNLHRESWEAHAWLTAKGKPVANRTAFQVLYAAIDALTRRGYNVFIHHLPSHMGIVGNEVADMLAKAGALL
ncbi:Ribonuclease H1 [Coemansia sp. RSA 1200]|nr:Ribonuclease H1 [Coemansia sp. RSA 1200]